MKARRDKAMGLLRGLYREEGNPFVFIGKQPGAHVSGVSLTEALRRAGCTATIHGMRSAFSDWAHERTNHSNHAIELSLAHRIGKRPSG
jgi:hypothetical protein